MDLLVLSMAKKYADSKVPEVTASDNGKVVSVVNGALALRVVDSAAASGSTNLITSGAVYALLGEIEEALSEV